MYLFVDIELHVVLIGIHISSLVLYRFFERTYYSRVSDSRYNCNWISSSSFSTVHTV